MPGSNIVNANMAAAFAAKLKLAEATMDVHIKNSEAYARSKGSWDNPTGVTRETIGSKTQKSFGGIKSTVYHSEEGAGKYLELRRDFGGRYRVLVAARDHNLAMLWAALRRIFK